MPTWLKVLIILGAVVLLLSAAGVGVGVYLWRKHGRGLVEGGRRTAAEGREFGRRTNNQGCLDEAVARHRGAEGFADALKVNLFLGSCLDASVPTPGFCDGVPAPTEFVKTGQWGVQQCRKYELSPEKQCAQLFTQVQQYCAKAAGRQ